MNFLKITIAILLLTVLISCTSGLQKNYDATSKEDDLKEIAKKISEKDLILLKENIVALENNNTDLNTKRYMDLLADARAKNRLKEKKIREEKLKEENRIKAENLKKEVATKTSVLCNKKWKMDEYAFLMRIPDDSDESVQLGTDVLNKVMFIKDSQFIISVIKEGKEVFVKGNFDEKMTNLMSNHGKRTKEYFKDGTYKITYGKDTEIGSWEFVNATKIKEHRPPTSGTSYKKKSTLFFVDIKDLNETTFNFNENEYKPINYGRPVDTYTYIAMSL